MTEKKRKALSPENEGTPAPKKDVGDYNEAEKKKDRKKPRKSSSREQADTPMAGSSKKTKQPPPPPDEDDDGDNEDDFIPLPFTLPRAPAPDAKGKAKATEQQDQEMDPVTVDSDDDDDDVNFRVLGVSAVTTVGTGVPGMSNKLVTTFDPPAYVYYGDHMSPFRGIIADWKRNTEAARVEISDMFRKNTKRKLLVASSGWEFTPESKRAMIFAIEMITTQKPVEVEVVRKSAWAVVTMGDRSSVKMLLDQQVVFDPLRRALTTFRKPMMIPTERRVFEIKNVKARGELESLREILTGEGKVKIIEEVPPTGEWTTVFGGRIIWKVEASDVNWNRPNEAIVSNGNRLYFANAPTCDTCHSDDHHFSCCPWKTILPGVRFKKQIRK
jgi:hypothetical protein